MVVYLAKVNFNLKSFTVQFEYLTGVWRENGKLCGQYGRGLPGGMSQLSEDLLLARKYEWVKAQRGNIIPPHAVKTTILVGGRREERYVGRVGGEIVCAVSITDGMIDYFTDHNGSKSTSGEILLLTVDPSV